MPQFFIFLSSYLPVVAGAALAIFVFTLIRSSFAEYRLPGYVIFFGTVLHVLLLWNALPEDGRVVAVIARCILPGATSLLLCLCLGSTPVRSGLTAIGAYALICALTSAYDNMLIPVAAGVVLLPLFLAFHRIIADQLTMDAESRDMLGDSDLVLELYMRGFRPSGYYQGARRKLAAQANLRMHGVLPEDRCERRGASR